MPTDSMVAVAVCVKGGEITFLHLQPSPAWPCTNQLVKDLFPEVLAGTELAAT